MRRYPDGLLDFGRGLYPIRGRHVEAEYVGNDDMIRFVRGGCLETAEQCQPVRIDEKSDFFRQLPHERLVRTFARLDLASRLHEGRRAALSHQKGFAIITNDQRCGYPDRAQLPVVPRDMTR